MTTETHDMTPTVSEVVAPPTDPNRRRIRVGGKVVATVSATQVRQLGISVGSAWTDDLAASVARQQELDKTRRIALDLLARRARSESELTDRLTRRGIGAEVIRIVVAEMVEHHWVNDSELANQIINQLMRSGPCRPALARQKMQTRGLAENIIETALETAFTDRDDGADAISAAKLRLKKMGDAGGPVAARRIAGFLARRGFEGEAIEAAIDHLGLLSEG